MTDCFADFTIEPFEDGAPGPHVTRAIDAVAAMGLDVAVGPFGTTVTGTAEEVVAAVGAALAAGLAESATRITVTVTNPGAGAAAPPDHPVFTALAPVFDAIGAEPVGPGALRPADVPIEWEGEAIGGIRIHSLHGAVRRMVEQLAGDMGGEVSRLDRTQKQQLVRMLDERGAFVIRGAVEEVADLMEVSRITVYNYLNATSRES